MSGDVLARLQVVAAAVVTMAGAVRVKGSLSSGTTPPGVVFFHPEHPILGNVPPGPLGEAHLRLKVHDVAFMLRALRSVVRDVRPGVPQAGQEPLTNRFPVVRIPEDRKVRRHCRHSFVSCVTYLSHLARQLGLDTHNDKPTVRQGKREGLCYRQSRRLSIFCESIIKKPSAITKGISTEVQKGVSGALEKLHNRKLAERENISSRMKSIKPTVPRTRKHIFKDIFKLIIEITKKVTAVKVKEKHVLPNIRNTTHAHKLDLYRQTVTALQYMCWYTMHGVPHLAHLLQCDSSDPKRTKPDGDSRASENDDPFGCALYSFCPNPCCGGLREPSRENFWNRFSNPCRLHGLKGGGGCKIPREQNLNYNILVDHGVQVSCECGTGRRYEPVAGLCVWGDHCAVPAETCPKPHQHCFNLFGGQGCRCGPDYRWSDFDQRCVPLYPTKKEEEEESNELEEVMDSPFFKWLNNLFHTSVKQSQKSTPNYNWSLI